MRADRQDVRQDEGALRQDRQQLQRVNTLGPAPDNSNRTGKIPCTTVKISKQGRYCRRDANDGARATSKAQAQPPPMLPSMLARSMFFVLIKRK